MKQTYQYPDTQPGDEDVFSREPFAIWWQSPKTGEMFQNQAIAPCESAGQRWLDPSTSEGGLKGLHPDPSLVFIPTAASSLRDRCLWEAHSPARASLLGKPLLLPWAVGWWMHSVHSLGAVSVWVLGQGLPSLAQLRPSRAPGRGHCATTEITLVHSHSRSCFFLRKTPLLTSQSLFLCDSFSV